MVAHAKRQRDRAAALGRSGDGGASARRPVLAHLRQPRLAAAQRAARDMDALDNLRVLGCSSPPAAARCCVCCPGPRELFSGSAARRDSRLRPSNGKKLKPQESQKLCCMLCSARTESHDVRDECSIDCVLISQFYGRRNHQSVFARFIQIKIIVKVEFTCPAFASLQAFTEGHAPTSWDFPVYLKGNLFRRMIKKGELVVD